MLGVREILSGFQGMFKAITCLEGVSSQEVSGFQRLFAWYLETCDYKCSLSGLDLNFPVGSNLYAARRSSSLFAKGMGIKKDKGCGILCFSMPVGNSLWPGLHRPDLITHLFR